MVSTRHHPRPFPEPTTPGPSATGSSGKSSASPTPENTITVLVPSSTRKTRSTRSSAVRRNSSSSTTYAHKVPPLLMIWLWVSLPLVIWDTSYMFLRPHSMPGGKFHWPLWQPYALYGTVDYVYGWPAWDNHVGFSAAQASLNAVETAFYIYYLAVVYKNGVGNLFASQSLKEFLVGASDRTVSGPGMAEAVVVLFSAAVMTLSKTVLYWLNEYFSGFANIGHNTPFNLFLLWIVPNGLWLVFPTYMIYVLGTEIVATLNGYARVKAE